MKNPRPPPLVFRIRDTELKRRFADFVDAESKRTGYVLEGTAVAERIIREFLDARSSRRKR